MGSNLAKEIGNLVFPDLAQRTRDFHDGVEFADVNEAVAIRAWHLRIHLCDDSMRTFGGGKRRIDANTEAAVTVRVRRRHLNEGHVNWHLAALEQALDF